MACVVSAKAAVGLAVRIGRDLMRLLNRHEGSLCNAKTESKNAKSHATEGIASSRGAPTTSIIDVIRQAENAFDESTRRLNLISARVLKKYLALRPHEMLAGILDSRLTRVDKRQLLRTIKESIPIFPLRRTVTVGSNNMKAQSMYFFRNTPVIVISTVFSLLLGAVGIQAWRNTARVLTFPEQPLVLTLPNGSSRSVVVPRGTALSVIEHSDGAATVRIWQNKRGYATAQVKMIVE
jgi:hypothetical protein